MGESELWGDGRIRDRVSGEDGWIGCNERMDRLGVMRGWVTR